MSPSPDDGVEEAPPERPEPHLPSASPLLALVGVALLLLAGASLLLGRLGDRPVASFKAQACALPSNWLKLAQRGYFRPRSGQISVLPKTPAYMASGGSGWSHSGPWPYLQDIPLVFYGPGIVSPHEPVDRAVTMADVAPPLARRL